MYRGLSGFSFRNFAYLCKTLSRGGGRLIDNGMVVFPNAKINIGLFVTRRREDGYHDIETVFYPLGLSDVLEITPADGPGGQCDFVSTGLPVDCDPADNLVVKAYCLLADERPMPAVHAHLHKVIPHGAGLGGGSSDAAFMLRGLNRLFCLGLTSEQLEERAARLGSDCAFFVRDEAVFAHGRGELMEPLPLSLEGYRLGLVKPDRGVSTAEAYRGIRPAPAAMDLRDLCRLPVEQWRERVRNDFEATVMPLLPEIGEVKRRLYAMGAVFAAMTGSGSAVFGLFRGEVPDLAAAFPGYFTWRQEE